MKTTDGKVTQVLPGGQAMIVTALPEDVDDGVRVFWPDKDEITPEQRRKIFAINGEIAAWSGDDPESVRKTLVSDFLLKKRQDIQMRTLSLASGGGCDKGTASLLIDFLINLVLEYGIPTKQPLMEYADDLEKYTYAALMNKKCLVCGKKADLHHAEGSMIGMGYNRNEKCQIGAMVMPLCRTHHGEYHQIGATAFDAKYHTVAVPMDKRIADKYGLTRKAKGESE